MNPNASETESSEPPELPTTAESNGSGTECNPSSGDMVMLNNTASMDRIRTALMEVLKQSKEDNDDISAFCHSIASCLRKMNHRNLAIAKLRIQKILFDYESSIQAGGNDRWNSANINSSGGGISNSTLQISSSGSDRSTMPVVSRQHSTHITSISNSHSNSSEGKGLKSQRVEINNTSVSVPSGNVTHGLDSPSSSSQSKSSTMPSRSDHSQVTSSCRNDRLSSFGLGSQNESSVKSLRSHQTNVSEGSYSTSKSSLNQPSTSTNRTTDHNHSSQSQPISLESLHLKRRSDFESSSGKGTSSVLKFGSFHNNAHNGGSGDSNCQNSGTDSPKPLSAEQLRVLAKNLKITIKNSQAKSSDDDDDESDSSSEESGDDSDSEDVEDDNNDDEKEVELGVKRSGSKLRDGRIADDTREIESESSVVQRNSTIGRRELDEVVSPTDPDDGDSDTDRNDIAAALATDRS